MTRAFLRLTRSLRTMNIARAYEIRAMLRGAGVVGATMTRALLLLTLTACAPVGCPDCAQSPNAIETAKGFIR